MFNLGRGSAAAFFFVVLMFGMPRTAFAAATLSAISVQGAPGGAARITLTFVGAVPRYQISGQGTSEITISLPETVRSPNVPLANTGAGSVTGYTISTGASNLTQIVLHLVAPVNVTEAIAGGRLVLQAASAASVSPTGPNALTPLPTPTPSAPGLGRGQSIEIVSLKYADVSEVVGILVPGQTIPPNDTFSPAGSIFSLPSSAGAGGIGQTTTNPAFNNGLNNAPQSFGQRINDNIAIDRRLNAILLIGTPQEIAGLRALIDKIDVPQTSVILECQVFELSETAAKDVGLELSNSGSNPVITGSASSKTGDIPQFSGSLTAQIFAEIRRGGGRVLATPRILALNGNAATILSGDALPIVTTTTFPGSPPSIQTTVNYIAVGVNLQIQPRIAEDGYVTSHIFAEVSSVTAFSPTASGPVPQVSLRQVSTSATVKDGTPFVIGGLLQDNEIRNMSKIPILGDIPLIGGLFRARHDTLTRTSLYIMVTPHITRPGQTPTQP
ncbi:MAG: hypothetical protein M3007_03240 [Candidatus Eremiobacteraeota bacterium]|nr:hypothetical protein [Candidatus Eremiobacteraeota bacterium]